MFRIKYPISFILAWHCSIVIGFSVPYLLNALIFTDESTTPIKSLKRYTQTFRYLYLWHLDNCFNKNTLTFKGI